MFHFFKFFLPLIVVSVEFLTADFWPKSVVFVFFVLSANLLLANQTLVSFKTSWVSAFRPILSAYVY